MDELSALAGTDLELVGVSSKGQPAGPSSFGELRTKSVSGPGVGAGAGGALNSSGVGPALSERETSTTGSRGMLGSAVTKRSPKQKRPSAL